MRAPRFHTTLEPLEREILGNITAAVSEAIIARAQSVPRDDLSELTGIPSGHKNAPEDPALARLLPNFEREGDEEYDGDNSLLRSLHENDICRAKLSNLQVVAEKVGPDGGVDITLTEEEAHAFLAGLNDLRIYISADDAGGEDARAEREQLVEWLGFNQDSLLTALTG